MKSKLTSDGIISLIIRFFYLLLTFIISVALARLLGAEGYGIYSYVFAIISVLAIVVEFGIPTLIIRETSKYLTNNDFGLLKGVLLWSSRTIITCLIFIQIGALFVSLFIGNKVNELYTHTFYWGLCFLIFIALGALVNSVLKGLNKVILGQLTENIIIPAGLLIIVLFVNKIYNKELCASDVMLAHSVAAIFAFVIGIVFLIINVPRQLIFIDPLYMKRKWLSSAFPIAVVNGVGILNNWISIIVIGLFINEDKIGIYRVALQASFLSSSGLQVVNIVLAPQFAQLYAKKNWTVLQEIVTLGARVALIINILITIVFVIWGRQLLYSIYGKEFIFGYYPLLILLLGQFFNSLTGSVALLLNMTDHEKLTFRVSIITIIINIFLNFLFSYYWNITGAAIASTLSIIISNSILWWLVWKNIEINSLAIIFKK
jgi:O-antigen/teichoic acid export membrane protein